MSEQTTTKKKPEVHYMGPIIIKEWWYTPEDEPKQYVAVLSTVLNHPVLGDCEQVRTSALVVWPDKEGNFETRNTKYIRVYQKSMSEIGLSEFNQNS